VKHFGKSFVQLAHHRMGGLQMAVFAKKSMSKKIQGVQVLDVACGVGNVLTNKGAVCVLLRMQGKTLAFVNAHFAAHQTKVKERNQDYTRVTESIISRAPKRWLHKGYIVKKLHKKTVSASVSKRTSPLESLLSKQPAVIKNLFSSKVSIEIDENKSRKWKRRSKKGSIARATLESTSKTEDSHLRWPFDGVVFLGDFNYRLELPRLEV
jgi:hypothetical protein